MVYDGGGGRGLKGLTVRILSLSDVFPETMNSFHLFLINFCAPFKPGFFYKHFLEISWRTKYNCIEQIETTFTIKTLVYYVA